MHRAFLQTRLRQNRYPHQNLDTLEEISEEPPGSAGVPAGLSYRVTNTAFWSEFDTSDTSQVPLALAKVDEIYRAPVALFYLDDRSYKEISTILDVPLGTVKSRIARGIAQLRDILFDDHSRESSLDR